MRKKLLKLDNDTLNKIASDISILEGTREQKAAAIAEYVRGYGYKWSDLVSRYRLKEEA